MFWCELIYYSLLQSKCGWLCVRSLPFELSKQRSGFTRHFSHATTKAQKGKQVNFTELIIAHCVGTVEAEQPALAPLESTCSSRLRGAESNPGRWFCCGIEQFGPFFLLWSCRCVPFTYITAALPYSVWVAGVIHTERGTRTNADLPFTTKVTAGSL